MDKFTALAKRKADESKKGSQLMLFDANNQSSVVSARSMVNQLLQIRDALNLGFVALGKTLVEIARTESYRVNGHETMESFLGDPDVAVSRSTAFRSMRIFIRFCEDYHIPEVELGRYDVSKLETILPVVEEETKDEWLAKCETESRSDLIEDVREAQGREPSHREKLMNLGIPPGQYRLVKVTEGESEMVGFEDIGKGSVEFYRGEEETIFIKI